LSEVRTLTPDPLPQAGEGARIWRTTRFAIDLSRPRVMGIVNVTPDSFSDGDPALTPARALARCEKLLADGADLLDIGAESSRPGAVPVGLEVERARLMPFLVEALKLGCPISVDTTRPEVMREALDLGADIVNDISALRSPGALETIAAHGSCGVGLMHMRGTPATMQGDATYADVVDEVRTFLKSRLDAVRASGVRADRLVVDPGIGFGKTPAHCLALLHRQVELLGLGVPLLVGWSRKSALARVIGVDTAPWDRSVDERARVDAASVVTAVLAVERGARIVRVHDVAATVAALVVWRAASGTTDNLAALQAAPGVLP
jgi:dihydropteroate synthase